MNLNQIGKSNIKGTICFFCGFGRKLTRKPPPLPPCRPGRCARRSGARSFCSKIKFEKQLLEVVLIRY